VELAALRGQLEAISPLALGMSVSAAWQAVSGVLLVALGAPRVALAATYQADSEILGVLSGSPGLEVSHPIFLLVGTI
jgi:hypothetical protein